MPVRRRKTKRAKRHRKSSASKLQVMLKGRGFRLPHGYKIIRCKTCKKRKK